MLRLSLPRLWRFALLLLLGLASGFCLPLARGQVFARQGQGWLERIDGYPVLHVKGSHYEMGYQEFQLNELLQRRPDAPNPQP